MIIQKKNVSQAPPHSLKREQAATSSTAGFDGVVLDEAIKAIH